MTAAVDSELRTRLQADAEPLRRSFAIVAAQPREFAAAFYQRLFELAPDTRQLFPADMQWQQSKFAQSLATIVDCLNDPVAILPALHQLGARHSGYGTSVMHYAPVGEALLGMLEQASGGQLEAPVRQAWRRLYGWIVAEMLSGAREATS
jgi:hemoglobin-like flavoprotein